MAVEEEVGGFIFFEFRDPKRMGAGEWEIMAVNVRTMRTVARYIVRPDGRIVPPRSRMMGRMGRVRVDTLEKLRSGGVESRRG